MSTNIFKRLRDLVPLPPVLVGRVTAHHADDTSTVELPVGVGLTAYGGTVATGSLIRPRGRTVPVGEMAFVRAGVIETKAPDGIPVPTPIGTVITTPLPTPTLFCQWVATAMTVAGFNPGDEVGSGLTMSNDGSWLVIRKEATSPSRSAFSIFQVSGSNFALHSTFEHVWQAPIVNGTTHCRQYLSADASMLLVVEREASNACRMFLYTRTGTSWAVTDSLDISHWGSNPDVAYSPAFFGDGSAIVVTGRGVSFSGLKIVEIPVSGGTFGAATVHDLSANHASATPYLTGAVSASYDGSRITALVDDLNFEPVLESFVKVAGVYQHEATIYAGQGIAILDATDPTKLIAGIQGYGGSSNTVAVKFTLVGGAWNPEVADDADRQPVGGFSGARFYTYTLGASLYEWGEVHQLNYVCSTTPPPPPPTPTHFILDNFDGSGTLATHSPDVGPASYSVPSGAPSSAYVLDGAGAVEHDDAGGTTGTHVGLVLPQGPGTADYYIEAEGVFPSGANAFQARLGVFGRTAMSATPNFAFHSWLALSQDLEYAAGSSLQQIYPQSVTVDVPFTIRVEVTNGGADYTTFINGAPVGSLSPTSPTVEPCTAFGLIMREAKCLRLAAGLM